MNVKEAPRAIADISEGTILATVSLEAPPDRVFQALTDPKEVRRWWGSDMTYRITDWFADLRVGGRWRSAGHSASGEAFSAEGEFLAVDPPTKLGQTWRSDWDRGYVSSLTYQIEPVESGARLVLRHDGFRGRPELCRSHAEEWERVLTLLQAYFAHNAVRPALQFFLFRLVAPRPTFPDDMTAQEATAMERHFSYWAENARDGKAVVYGPVSDPTGTWGLAVVRVADHSALSEMELNDPIIQAGLGFRYVIFSMPRAIVSG